jgi:ribosomal protein S3AE
MVKIIKKKYFEVDIPLINEKAEVLSDSLDQINGKTLKLDMTRILKGKSSEMIFSIKIKDGKAIAEPKKLTVLPYFIRHMLHVGVDYVEDSFSVESQESKLIVKPFLITRKKVSRAVKRTLRNSAKNFLQDYIKIETNDKVFEEILSGQLQKALSLKLKKIYPLGLCEIRMIQVENNAKKPEQKIETKEEIKEVETSKNIGSLGEELADTKEVKKPEKIKKGKKE